MTKADYENIASCIRRRGTRTQRTALSKMKESTGWDQTHGNTLEIQGLKERIAELESENFVLRVRMRRGLNEKED